MKVLEQIGVALFWVEFVFSALEPYPVFYKRREKGKIFYRLLYIYTAGATRFLLFDNTVVIGNLTCSVSAALSGALCLNYPYFCYVHLHIFAAATSHFPMRGERTVGVSSYLTDAQYSCISRVTGVKQFRNLVHAHTHYVSMYSLHVFDFSYLYLLYSSHNAHVLCQLKRELLQSFLMKRKRIGTWSGRENLFLPSSFSLLHLWLKTLHRVPRFMVQA